MFSDERLVGILESHLPLGQVFVDCPLSLPPCVACARPSCPGAVRCDEVAVGYMLALTMRLRGKGARRTRPVNPQSQRVWDVMRMTREPTGREPSFSANQAPLVSRARILQRRLNAALPGLVLRETNVPEALHGCGAWLGIPEELISRYRDFEGGAAVRWSLARYLVDGGWLAVDEDDLLRQCCQTVESFHALMTAWVAALNWRGLTDRAPGEFADPEGWVFLPELAVPMATTDTSYSQ